MLDDKRRLRRADLVASLVVFGFGLWVVLMAFRMPMKDSWGGVQNVWYVSPALFPLGTGLVIMLLAVYLARIAVQAIGLAEARDVLAGVARGKFLQGLLEERNVRFYSILLFFLSYVYLYIPRVDFFVATLLFLLAFIAVFYFDEYPLLARLTRFYLGGALALGACFALGAANNPEAAFPYLADALALALTLAFGVQAWRLTRGDPSMARRFRISVIVAVATPLVLCPVFKFFLLVPLPTEGLVTELMDMVWYGEF